MIARGLAAALVLVGLPAAALESAEWPPPAPLAERMRELQREIVRRDASPAEREAAREELAALLKSPAGRSRGRTRDERPARAAIEPFPRIVAPANIAPAAPPPPGVARIEIVPPPKPVVDPRTGSAPAPAGAFAIDPRTGAVLHGPPGGPYVDPRTGQLVPR